ncbi:MAG: tripartite tricarboxylate transporter substrate binding protein [Rhodospirillaceae bacterium]|jgi:tripartite-type tricarboxylate transporter receptor subunit TctC
MKLVSKLLGSAAVAALLVSGFVATAQAKYPKRTVTWVVPFGAGGGTDRWSRIMSTAGFEEKIWGRGLRVRNIPGASGVKGWKWMMDKKADGHTILMASPTPVLALARESKPILDPLKDIKICAFIGYFRPNVTIHKGKPYTDLKSLVAYAKKNPGTVTVGGSGSNILGAAVLFKQFGVTMNYVQYPGSGPAVSDFLGKHIDIMVGPDEIMRNHAPKKATIVATSSNKPHPPGYEKEVGNKVPQPKDLGFKQSFEGLRWIGVHPKTKQSTCKEVSNAVQKTLKFKPVKKLMGKIKAQPIFTPMEQAQKDYVEMVKATRAAVDLLSKAKIIKKKKKKK